MLQRVQSLFLIFSAFCMIAFLATNSFVGIKGITSKVGVNAFQVFEQTGAIATFKQPVFYVAVLAGLSVILTIITLFLYRNRLKQTLMVALNSLLIGATLAVTVYDIQNIAMPRLDNVEQGSYGVGLYAAFLALISNWLANRFIKRDEKLVRDSERMR